LAATNSISYLPNPERQLDLLTDLLDSKVAQLELLLVFLKI
jgi:hypothetical protein